MKVKYKYIKDLVLSYLYNYTTNTKHVVRMHTKVRVPFRFGDEIDSTIHNLLGNLSDQANLKESYDQGGL